MASEPLRLDLTDEGINEVVGLARAADKLSEVMDASAKMKPEIGVKAFSKKLSSLVNIPSSALRPILVGILNFYHTKIESKNEIATVFDALTTCLERLA